MEDQNKNKLNKVAADLPEVPRKEDGKIDLEAIKIGTDEKGNAIVDNEVFNAYYRELPEGTRNQDQSAWITRNGGVFKMPTDDIRRAGADTLNARLAERKTFAEVIQATLVKKASNETIEDLELTTDTDHLAAITAAAIRRAERGDVKAMEFIRDTIGERPTDKISAEVTALTPEDKEMLARVQARLDQL